MSDKIFLLLQGHRVTEWVADAIGLPQYVQVFKDNLITVSALKQSHGLPGFTQAAADRPLALPALQVEQQIVNQLSYMQVLDFPLFVNDGGASLKNDLGVRPRGPLRSALALLAALV